MARRSLKDEFDKFSEQFAETVGKVWHCGEYVSGEGWSPPTNVYRVGNRMEVCVDLAGVDPREIDVQVHPGQLMIRGARQAPELPRGDDEPVRIVLMEINHGSFCRVVRLPARVLVDEVTSEYKQGLLWVRLPLGDV